MVYYINHSEVTSFPRHFPTLPYVAVRGSYRPQLVHEMQILATYGLLDDRVITTADSGTTNTRRFVRDRLWERFGARGDFDSQHLFLHIEATGTSGGRAGRATFLVSHPLDWASRAIPRMTGIGAAVGTILLGRHGRSRIGIRDPEEYYDSDEFLATLGIYEGVSHSESVQWF
jgi:saccharopine dehydrogenase-like NADP-dependent oxidoreductase